MPPRTTLSRYDVGIAVMLVEDRVRVEQVRGVVLRLAVRSHDTLEATDGRHTYQELVKEVGAKNVIDVKYTKVPDAEVKAFTTRWDGLPGR